MAFGLPALPSIRDLVSSLPGLGKGGGEVSGITDGKFKDYVFHCAVPTPEKPHGAVSTEMTTERKLQVIESAGIDGADVKDWGRKPRIFSAELVFFGPLYLQELSKFERVCNEGTPGLLTLPDVDKVVFASFQKMVVKTEAQASDVRLVSVTWIEAVSTPVQLQNAAQADQASLHEVGAATQSQALKTKSLLQDNPLISAVRAAENGISTVRAAANTVTTLADGVRNRITQIAADISATLDQVRDAAKNITDFFASDAPQFRSQIENAFKSPQSTGSKTDPVTGQEIGDFSEPDTTVTPRDLLTPPDPIPSVVVNTSGLRTPAAAEVAVNQLVASLTANRDQLTEDTQGRTDEIAQNITATINLLIELSDRVKPKKTRGYLVPVEMSLSEALFHNGIGIDQVDAYSKINTHLDDLMVIPKDSVVYL